MNALTRSTAVVALGVILSPFASSTALAQTATIYVDIVNGDPDPPNHGQNGWGTNAHRFLQDALTDADVLLAPPFDFEDVEIWVAAGTYRPDQSDATVQDQECTQEPCFLGDGDRDASFDLRNHVSLFGGFPAHPHTWNNGQGATFADRDPVAHETILSGDLRAANVSATAVLDGFVVRGGVAIRGAQPRFRDCVFALHEGAAVRCFGGSEVMFHRCTFTGVTCGAIVVDEASRLALVACEPSAALGDVHRSGIAHVSPCSELIAVDAAPCGPVIRATHLAPGQ